MASNMFEGATHEAASCGATVDAVVHAMVDAAAAPAAGSAPGAASGGQPNGLDPQRLAQRLDDLARGQGISRWDLGASCSTDSSVQVDRGESKQLKGAQRSAITVRVWNDQGLVGITSTSDLSPEGLARALRGAKDASAFGNPDDVPAFSPLATAPLPELDQPLREPVGILHLLDTLRGAGRPRARIHASSSVATIVRMALDGLGIALIPPAIVRNELASGRLIEISVVEKVANLTFAAAWRTDADSTVIAAIVDLARTVAAPRPPRSRGRATGTPARTPVSGPAGTR